MDFRSWFSPWLAGRTNVLMVGTSKATQGGIASVVRELEAAKLFERAQVAYVVTHVDGSFLTKAFVAAFGMCSAALVLLLRRPRLMHVHLSSRASFWRKAFIVFLAFLNRTPVLIHLHGSEFREFFARSGKLGQAIIRTAFARSARVVALSNSWKEWIDATAEASNVVVVPNFVALPEINSVSRESRLLLFMGRLGRRKGAFDLVRAFAMLSESCDNVRLVLAGDGEIAQVRALATELGVAARVDTPGWIGPQEKKALCERASAYLLPSYNEGLPMSVLEAMSYGLPIISTPIGGIPDAVKHGKNGFLVEPGDVPALAMRIEELLTTNGLIELMGSAARRTVMDDFSAPVITRCWLELYEEFGVEGVA